MVLFIGSPIFLQRQNGSFFPNLSTSALSQCLFLYALCLTLSLLFSLHGASTSAQFVDDCWWFSNIRLLLLLFIDNHRQRGWAPAKSEEHASPGSHDRMPKILWLKFCSIFKTFVCLSLLLQGQLTGRCYSSSYPIACRTHLEKLILASIVSRASSG